MTDSPQPWWANDPSLEEIVRRTFDEFERELERREPAGPNVADPVLSEILDRACWRELGAARDGLARARDRYDAAVLSARGAGLSWGEIARVLKVSKQLLHRQFGPASRQGDYRSPESPWRDGDESL